MSHQTSYPFAEIEPRLQRRWESEDRYSAREDSDREKFYCLAMFPYPSGRLHMGHVRNYTIADAIARYQRQLGKNVLHPIGWDAFGLPAENAANERGADPREWTRRNISTMRVQLQRMGMSYDWHRELTTCDSAYYRWEQWFFARLHKKGLVYRRYSEVNWDPVDQTVLANEQVVDGCGWRSGAPVEKRSIAQWFVRISAYAEELLAGLDTLEHWPAQVVQMQRNWIGRSEGSEISFALTAGDTRLTAFTTRADTLFGVVALVLSPGHALVEECARTDRALAEAVEHMRAAAAAAGTDAAATATATKLGHRLAVEVIHPLSGERLPVYVGNYVLSEYGSGVVMLVPAHDQRDFEFARQYGLPVRAVVLPEDGSLSTRTQDWSKAWTGLGVLTASERFDGMPAAVAAVEITRELARRGQGQSAVAWRLRDWGVSRQRYWGCPIPVVYDENDQPRISEDIPVELPAVQPSDGQSLLRLADHPDFATDRRPRRETDTLDTFFESSWYYARFCCPDFDEGMLDNRARYWLPVDQYVGGIEHAVLHLLYFRFFHRLMRDEGLVDGDEPVKRLLTQGMVIAHTWSIVDDSGRKQWVAANEVSAKRDDRGAVTSAVHRTSAKPAQYEGLHKMSKSKNNGVDPDALMKHFGADAVRLYVLFAAPPEQSLEWSSDSIQGCTRFLNRLYAYVREHAPALSATALRLNEQQLRTSCAADSNIRAARRQFHQLLRKAIYDFERSQFNTVAAALMEMMNLLQRCHSAKRCSDEFSLEVITVVLRLLAPMAPHLSEELWSTVHDDHGIEQAGFPEVCAQALQMDALNMVVQVNGRKRAVISLAVGASRLDCEEAALKHCRDIGAVAPDSQVVKIIVVENKLVNIVCR